MPKRRSAGGARHRLASLLPPALLTLLGLLALCATSPAVEDTDAPAAPKVHLLRIDGTIGPIVADYFVGEMAAAAEEGAVLVVLELDTPGGLDTSMRQMIRAIMPASVPVAVYVAPDGARAASAGVFILTAAHLAAMAPATNVGAAHPVNMGGQMDETMAEKVTNDAVAYLQGLARQRGRNVEWSERVVRESVSVTAEEALELGVIDLVATDLDDLLARADGRVVSIAGNERTLATEGAEIVRRHMDWRARFLQRITDPTVAYILLMLGFYGLFFELSNPGSLLPGIVGAICLLMAFLAFQSLPVNYVGVMLILLGLVLLLLEIKVTSYGALSVGGVAALLLGSLLMFDPGNPFGSLPLRVILPVVIFTVLLFLLLVGLGLAAQRRRHFSGLEALTGAEGEIVVAEGQRGSWHVGRMRIAGEYWECRSTSPLRAGGKVRVVARQERCLIVETIATDDGGIDL
jgi:membrane-bound serine protease (ClpP class)